MSVPSANYEARGRVSMVLLMLVVAYITGGSFVAYESQRQMSLWQRKIEAQQSVIKMANDDITFRLEFHPSELKDQELALSNLGSEFRKLDQVCDEVNQVCLSSVISIVALCFVSIILMCSMSKRKGPLPSRMDILKSIWDQTVTPTVLLDEQMTIRYANQAFADLAGLLPLQLCGHSVCNFILDDAGHHFLNDHELLKQRSLGNRMNAMIIRANPARVQNLVRFSLSLLPPKLLLSDSSATFIATFQDLSAEHTLLTVRQQMCELITTIVRGHLNNASLLIEQVLDRSHDCIPSGCKRALTMAQEESQRLYRLILDLLILNGREAFLNLEISPCSSNEIISRATQAVKRAAEKAGDEIMVQGEALLFHADKDAMVQVLINLLSNAISHTSHGAQIAVRTSKTDQTVRFEVEDDGPGINSDQVQLIFQPFKRGGAARPNREGFGIGLALCKMIVESHQGRIGVVSPVNPHGGSLFFFEIPLCATTLTDNPPRQFIEDF